jgi:hypothetical protein
MNNLLKKVILLALSSILLQSVFAQRTFSKMYDLFGQWENASTVISYDSNRIVLSGMVRNFGITDSTKQNRTFIWTINDSNQSYIKSVYGKNNNDYSGMVALLPPNSQSTLNIYLTNDYGSDTDSYFILKTNRSGDTLTQIKIEAPFGFASATWLLRGSKIYIYGV